MKSIKEFEKNLDDEHELCLQLASFGQSILLNVTELGCIIHFYGLVNGQKAHLIQNINQLIFLMLSTPTAEPEKPTRRIGFRTAECEKE